MKIFVINLPKDQARRSFVEEQFQKLKIEFEFFAGVYGRDLSVAELSRDYDGRKAMRTQCRPLVPAEIGIALSHLAVYRKILEDRIPFALILEDDSVLPKNLGSVLSALQGHKVMTGPSVILLSPAVCNSKRADPIGGGYAIAPYLSGFYSHAYVVTQASAGALLKALYPVGDVSDCWRRLRKHRVVDLFVVSPTLVFQNQSDFGSSTTADQRVLLPKKTVLQKMRFKARRAFWLCIDEILALFDRNFFPYCGTYKKNRRYR